MITVLQLMSIYVLTYIFEFLYYIGFYLYKFLMCMHVNGIFPMGIIWLMSYDIFFFFLNKVNCHPPLNNVITLQE